MSDTFERNFLKTLLEVTALFDKMHISYMVIGGMALSVWGRPRATVDLDFKLRASLEDLEKLKLKAMKMGYKIDHSWKRHNPLLANIQTRMLHRGIPIDLLLPRDDHDHQALVHRKRKKLGKRFFWFSSAEDLVLEKLKVGRPRDFEDAVTVLERMGERLDMRYLRRWAKKLGLQNELDYILEL